MWWKIVAICVILGFSLSEAKDKVKSVKLDDGPCEYRDTLNITSGFMDLVGDFHHEGTVYTRGSFAEYNYIIENFTNKIDVEPHIRGCICLYKNCIRICCRGDERNCTKPKSFNVPSREFDEQKLDLSKNVYGVLVGVPCNTMFSLNPQDYDYDRWYFSVSLIFKFQY
jgi:G protein-coupled receptor Mth (Methuselah protein)